ncbi:guanine nucleotide binding protein, alpha subunit [Globomyces pollinis-pini]|nr:guanine nucleotide binding protein, alpha subunit [Globomyces pollinis-pini]
MGNICFKPTPVVKVQSIQKLQEGGGSQPLKPALKTDNVQKTVDYQYYLSEKEKQSRTRDIDNYLKNEKIEMDLASKEPKILILGTSDSGKSTFLKQLKILHGAGFTSEEIQKSKLNILYNLTAISQKVISESKSEDLNAIFASLVQFRPSLIYQLKYLDEHVANNLIAFWADEAMKAKFYELGSIFPVSSTYFFDKFEEINRPDYQVTHQDILLLRSVTQNISDNRFEIKTVSGTGFLHFIDVSGLKYHRKRWIPYFDDCLAIVYVIDISSFDITMAEEVETNRLRDSIKLFESIVRNPLLANCELIVFFNKRDLFQLKIKKVSLKLHFPEYDGQDFDTEAGFTFLKNLYKQKQIETDKRKINYHTTCCTDTSAMSKIILDVSNSIITKTLSKSGYY